MSDAVSPGPLGDIPSADPASVLRSELASEACPYCSYFRADHPELWRDLVAVPTAYRSRRTGRVFLSDLCPHAAPFRGPYPSEQYARQTWRTEVARLAAIKAREVAELVRIVDRIIAERCAASLAESRSRAEQRALPRA